MSLKKKKNLFQVGISPKLLKKFIQTVLMLEMLIFNFLAKWADECQVKGCSGNSILINLSQSIKVVLLLIV